MAPACAASRLCVPRPEDCSRDFLSFCVCHVSVALMPCRRSLVRRGDRLNFRNPHGPSKHLIFPACARSSPIWTERAVHDECCARPRKSAARGSGFRGSASFHLCKPIVAGEELAARSALLRCRPDIRPTATCVAWRSTPRVSSWTGLGFFAQYNLRGCPEFRGEPTRA